MKAMAEADVLLKGMYWIPDAGACSGVYVLEDGRTLIDTGNMFGLIDELYDIGPIDRLERILLTHAHYDHIGGVAEIYQAASPDIYLHSVAREHLGLHQEPFPAFFETLEADGKLLTLSDGDVIEGESPLRAIHTPGHTAGDLCFFHERSGALFSGDLVPPGSVQGGRGSVAQDELRGGSPRDSIESLRKLLALPVRHLMPGHGEPAFHKGADRIKLALFNLYKEQYKAQPAGPWIAMGFDLLNAGNIEEARQCGAKASQIDPDSPEMEELKEAVKEWISKDEDSGTAHR